MKLFQASNKNGSILLHVESRERALELLEQVYKENLENAQTDYTIEFYEGINLTEQEKTNLIEYLPIQKAERIASVEEEHSNNISSLTEITDEIFEFYL